VDATPKDAAITDLPNILEPGDVLVFNDTKVIPSRLIGKKVNTKIEVTLHKEVSGSSWWAFARPGRKLKEGDIVEFARNFSAEIAEKRDNGEVLLLFRYGQQNLLDLLRRHGIMPLPPYIKRPDSGSLDDLDDYQTLYALKEGAVAAPTAGLHFTEDLISEITARGILTAFITLHVGAGTFLPVKTHDTEHHKMHTEWGKIEQTTADIINEARNAGGKIIPVGSTSLRILETAANSSGVLQPFIGETDIFITPGYIFKIADKMITNFHLPRSTLFMLVAAFSGLNRIKIAYTHAINQQYRFFSYGDACLLEKGKMDG
jgi:S-adenosylmethionine:tRNA ribosyltransferase-isomerase